MDKKQYSVRTAAVAATERRARRSGVAVAASGSGSSYNEIYGDIAGKLDREVFDSMFERVSEGVDAEGVERWYIRAKSDLVSVGDVTAYGNGGSGGGGSAGGGVTELRSLDDVLLGELKAGQILKYDGQHWVNGTIDAGLNETALAAYLQTNRYAKLSDIPSLADYATRSWVEDKGYATQSWVEYKGYATETWVTAQRYLTEHQDISHLLTRAEFDEMFERVDTDGGGWYIMAKSHLVSVGDVTAYAAGGVAGGGFGGSLGDLDDVQLGSLAADDVIKWDGQHWVNGPAPAGGVDESVLANYVTLDTEQQISGHKRFTWSDTDFSYRITLNGNFEDTIHNYPQVMWHVSNRRWTKAVMDTVGDIHFLEGSSSTFDGAHQGLVASKFVRNGGTASQFLKADGSVDDTQYLYHRRTAEFFNIDSIDAAGGGLYEIWRPAGTQVPNLNDWYKVFDWGANDNGYRVQMATALTMNGSMYFRHKCVGNWQPWREILDSANYAGILDGRYVNKAGDTMTGPLRIAHNSTNVVLYTQYNTAGAYSNVIWANVDESRVIFGSPNWLTVELETANSATAAYRRTNGVQYKIWDSGNHGSGSGLDADLLDGYHGDDYFRQRKGYISADYFNGVVFQNLNPGTYTYNYGGASGMLVSFGNLGASASSLELYTTYSDEADIHYRKKIDSNRFAGEWNTLITNRNIWAYNAGSATKLQTARTLRTTSYNDYRAGDGVEFDGTGDVTLKLPNSICASDWFRSYGSSGWYNQDYGGGICMIDSTWIRTYNAKSLLINGTSAAIGAHGFNVGVKVHHDNHVAFEASAGNYTMGLGCHSDGKWYWYRGTSSPWGTSGKSYVMTYDGASWQFTGHILATGDVTAYSDARLKSDVRPLTNRGFITPRTYIKDGKRSIGFLAQEVQQLYPELVMDTGGADHWLSLNYGNLVAVLEAQIIDHEERIKRLEARA